MNTEELTNKLKECDDIDIFLNENEGEFNEDSFREFLGGKAPLRSKLRRDAIVIYSIEKGLSLAEADDLLYHYNQSTLSD